MHAEVVGVETERHRNLAGRVVDPMRPLEVVPELLDGGAHEPLRPPVGVVWVAELVQMVTIPRQTHTEEAWRAP